MAMKYSRPAATIDAYIATFPRAIQVRLRKVRAVIRANAPRASECISYRIPAFQGHRMLVYFAGFRNHVGLYPPVRGDAALGKAVAKFAGPKGNLRFPHDQPLPVALIARIVRYKVKLDLAKAKEKKAPMSRGEGK